MRHNDDIRRRMERWKAAQRDVLRDMGATEFDEFAEFDDDGPVTSTDIVAQTPPVARVTRAVSMRDAWAIALSAGGIGLLAGFSVAVFLFVR